jgi:hypothetical protein
MQAFPLFFSLIFACHEPDDPESGNLNNLKRNPPKTSGPLTALNRVNLRLAKKVASSRRLHQTEADCDRKIIDRTIFLSVIFLSVIFLSNLRLRPTAAPCDWWISAVWYSLRSLRFFFGSLFRAGRQRRETPPGKGGSPERPTPSACPDVSRRRKVCD